MLNKATIYKEGCRQIVLFIVIIQNLSYNYLDNDLEGDECI